MLFLDVFEFKRQSYLGFMFSLVTLTALCSYGAQTLNSFWFPWLCNCGSFSTVQRAHLGYQTKPVERFTNFYQYILTSLCVFHVIACDLRSTSSLCAIFIDSSSQCPRGVNLTRHFTLKSIDLEFCVRVTFNI